MSHAGGEAVEARVILPSTARMSELRRGRGHMMAMVDPSVGSTRLDMHINVLKEGGEQGPYHLHRVSENVYYVLEGTVRVRIDGVDHDLTPGMAGFIPPGVPHSVTNAGRGDARIIEIYSPPEAGYELVEEED